MPQKKYYADEPTRDRGFLDVWRFLKALLSTLLQHMMSRSAKFARCLVARLPELSPGTLEAMQLKPPIPKLETLNP